MKKNPFDLWIWDTTVVEAQLRRALAEHKALRFNATVNAGKLEVAFAMAPWHFRSRIPSNVADDLTTIVATLLAREFSWSRAADDRIIVTQTRIG